VAISDRAAGIVGVVIHVVLGLTFVLSGAATWLWQRVEGEVSWRTGPTAIGVIRYFAIFWCAWLIIEALARLGATRRRSAARNSGRSAAAGSSAGSHALRDIVTSCVLVATQVLIPSMWLPLALAMMLLASLLNAYIIREPLRRAITSWAWSGAGVALATLLIHPWFIGQPLFVVRLAIVMTIWDWIGAHIGVTPRLLRVVPSLYSGSFG
jgi:hypothetical protein